VPGREPRALLESGFAKREAAAPIDRESRFMKEWKVERIRMRGLGGAVALLLATSLAVAAEKPVLFWNLTNETVTSLRLAPTGTKDFGPDLIKGDSDGAVDHDERLAIKTLAPGAYDASIGFKSGRACRVEGLKIEAASVFSIEEKDLLSCSR
jgi:hypothetical protein